MRLAFFRLSWPMLLTVAACSQYLRLVAVSPSSWAVQTAVVTCLLRDRASGAHFSVDLVSTVHLASREYYESLQRSCNEQYDRVCFEMIADDACFDTNADGIRRLVTPLKASEAQRSLAARYGLAAQADALDCTGGRFVHADMSRSEMGETGATLSSGGPLLTRLREAWDGIAVGATAPAMERSSSLMLRVAACALPAPELLLLLDDWIVSGGATASPALRPIARAALCGDFVSARALALAQTLITGERSQTKTLAGEMVRMRNLQAVASVQAAVDSGCSSIALLFGALHMRDMRSLLERQFDLDAADQARWETAWTIRSAVPARTDAVLPLAAVSLLVVDAGDWLETVRLALDSLGAANGDAVGEAALAALLYLVRHATIYATLATFVFDWNSRWFADAALADPGVRPGGVAAGTASVQPATHLERWLDETAARAIRALEAQLGIAAEEAPAPSQGQPAARSAASDEESGLAPSGYRRGSRGFKERVQKAMAGAGEGSDGPASSSGDTTGDRDS